MGQLSRHPLPFFVWFLSLTFSSSIFYSSLSSPSVSLHFIILITLHSLPFLLIVVLGWVDRSGDVVCGWGWLVTAGRHRWWRSWVFGGRFVFSCWSGGYGGGSAVVVVDQSILRHSFKLCTWIYCMFVMPNIIILSRFYVFGPHWILMKILINSWFLMHFDLSSLFRSYLGIWWSD